MGKKRYRVVWVSVERHYKMEFDTLEEAEARFAKVCKSPRMRLVRLFDVTDRLKPHPIKTSSGLANSPREGRPKLATLRRPRNIKCQGAPGTPPPFFKNINTVTMKK